MLIDHQSISGIVISPKGMFAPSLGQWPVARAASLCVPATGPPQGARPANPQFNLASPCQIWVSASPCWGMGSSNDTLSSEPPRQKGPHRMPHQGSSLQGRVVLVVQRWIIASALASPFEANGARVLLAASSRSGLALADHPDLSAAVVDSGSRELCRHLFARGIPFLFYTGHD